MMESGSETASTTSSTEEDPEEARKIQERIAKMEESDETRRRGQEAVREENRRIMREKIAATRNFCSRMHAWMSLISGKAATRS